MDPGDIHQITQFAWSNIGERLYEHFTVDIPSLFCVVILVVIAWTRSYLVDSCVWYTGKFVCWSCLVENENVRKGYKIRKRNDISNHIGDSLKSRKKRKKRFIEDYDHDPFDFTGLTKSRLHAYSLALSTLFLFLSICGVLYFFEFYLVLLVKLATGVFLLVWTQVSRSNWLYSYLLRYYMLYYDYVRVGDIVLYKKDGKEYKIMAVHPLTTILRRETDVEANKEILPLPVDVKKHIKETYLDVPIPNVFLLDPDRVSYNFVQYS